MTFNLLKTMRHASRNLSSILVLTAALGVGVSLVGIAPAHARRQDTKEAKDKAIYTIKRVYKTGEVDRYRVGVKIAMDSPEMPVNMVEAMVMKETTKEADDDGACKVLTEFEHAVMTVNGMEMDIGTMLPKIMTSRDKDGKTDVKMEGGDPEAGGDVGDQAKEFNNFSTVFLPKKPVKVGDSWEVNATGFGPPDPNAKGKGTLISVETVKGVKVAKIKVVVDMVDEMNNKVRADTLVLVDLATGKTLDLISKTVGDSAEGKVNLEMTMRMLSPNDKGDGKEAIKG